MKITETKTYELSLAELQAAIRTGLGLPTARIRFKIEDITRTYGDPPNEDVNGAIITVDVVVTDDAVTA